MSAQPPLFQLRSHLLQIAPEEERAEAWEGIDGIRVAQIRAGKLDAELYIGIGRARYELAERLCLAVGGLDLHRHQEIGGPQEKSSSSEESLRRK